MVPGRGSRWEDPYTDPVSGVMWNRLGCTDGEELREAEAAITFARIVELNVKRLEGSYDLGHLRAFHHHIFSDVYSWAGELRTVDLAGSHPFALARFLEGAAAPIFAGLENENWIRDLGRDWFVRRLAHYLGEVNALHPFREGNGRAQRAFFGQLARDAGFRIAWERLNQVENDSASAASLVGDFGPLESMLDRLVEP